MFGVAHGTILTDFGSVGYGVFPTSLCSNIPITPALRLPLLTKHFPTLRLTKPPSLCVASAVEHPLTALFVDCDSYFASVEQHLDPTLRCRPVSVAPVMAETSCCIAASYEAKAFGVKTGTPAVCPCRNALHGQSGSAGVHRGHAFEQAATSGNFWQYFRFEE